MNFRRSLDEIKLHSAWVTVGVFDGLHRGHQAIVRRMVEQAHTAGTSAVLLTFHPSPVAVLRGDKNFQYLTLLEERADLAAALGVDHVVALEFTPALSQQTAEDFIQHLVAQLGMQQLWVGQDFALGRNRQGNLAVLQELGVKFGYQVEVVHPVSAEGGVISSSRIRALLAEGELREANSLLGRWYDMTGEVIHGDGRGRKLGFPTANISISPEKLLPRNGVYAGWVWIGGACLPSVVNIGVRPTFDQEQTIRRVEAHLLGFEQDIYGSQINLHLVEFIRPEKRFESVNSLVHQIGQDIHASRELLLRMDLESRG